MKEICTNCKKHWSCGPIYFAYDRKYCSSFCREISLKENKSFGDKYNICWREIPTVVESSVVVTPLPSMKSSLSLVKGMDQIELIDKKNDNSELLNSNINILFNNYNDNNMEKQPEVKINHSNTNLNFNNANNNQESYFNYLITSCIAPRKNSIYMSLLLYLLK